MVEPLYWSALVLDTTPRVATPDKRLVISSVSPSAKYWSPAAPMFLNGSTASILTPGSSAGRRLRCQSNIPMVAVTRRPSTKVSQEGMAGRRPTGLATPVDSAGWAGIAAAVGVVAVTGDSAWANCAGVVNRSAGIGARAVKTTRSSCSGTAGRRRRRLGTSPVIRLAAMAWPVGPLNGTSPASIS